MKVVVFNGSGILMKSDLSGANLLLKEFGKEEEMIRRQKEYEAKKAAGPWGSEELATLFEGISEKEIDEKAKEIVKVNLREGAKRLVQELKEKGVFVACYSNDLVNILEAIAEEIGLDSVYGTTLEFEDGRATGKLAVKTERYDRANKIKELVESKGLNKRDAIIVGDSVTAAPSADHGTLIAFGSKSEALNEVAKANISDLSEVLGFLE